MPIKKMFSIDGIDWLSPIIDGIYRWGDSPFYGLDHVQHLDLQDKRKKLFGRCEIERCINPDLTCQAIVLCNYVYLDCEAIKAEKIFFPFYLLRYATELKQNYSSSWSWSTTRSANVCCPMAKPRYPRIIASCWLANHQSHLAVAHTQNWHESDQLTTLLELLQLGELKDWTNSFGPTLAQLPFRHVPNLHEWDRDAQFRALYPVTYSTAAACIVIGAVSWEWASELCEKYLFAVYGGCIPVVHGYHIYDKLEDLGFDTFKDLIDTSSQYEKNPILSIWKLLDRNLNFFQNSRSLIERPDIQRRLRHNYQIAQDIGWLYRKSIQNLNTDRALTFFNQHKIDIWQAFQIPGLNYSSLE